MNSPAVFLHQDAVRSFFGDRNSKSNSKKGADVSERKLYDFFARATALQDIGVVYLHSQTRFVYTT